MLKRWWRVWRGRPHSAGRLTNMLSVVIFWTANLWMNIVPFVVQFNRIWQPEEKPNGKGMCFVAPHDRWHFVDA